MIKFLKRMPPSLLLIGLFGIVTIGTMVLAAGYQRNHPIFFTIIQYSDNGNVIETWEEAKNLDTAVPMTFTNNKTGKQIMLPATAKYTIKEN